jgi:hypothetical protein
MDQHSAAIEAVHRILARSPDILEQHPELRSILERSGGSANH